MNTRDTLLQTIYATPAMKQMVDKIDFRRLEDFVTAQLSGFVQNRGADAVRYDLNYDVQTPTDSFLTNLLQFGSVQLLKENGLLHHESFIDALYVLISAINIVIADFLRKNAIAQVASYRYFDADPQYVLLERAVEQIDSANGDERSFSRFATSNGYRHSTAIPE